MALPMLGSIFSGVVLAFLLISFLLSLVLVLTAMPEGESSSLFLEPHGLVVGNGVMAFASSQGVGQHFARCSTGSGLLAGNTVLFLLFCLLACWLDELPGLLFGLANARKTRQAENKDPRVVMMTMPNRNSNKGQRIAQKGLQCFLFVAVGFAPLYMLPALEPNAAGGQEGVPGMVMVSFFSFAVGGLLLGLILCSADLQWSAFLGERNYRAAESAAVFQKCCGQGH
jgi:hypothetical protein